MRTSDQKKAQSISGSIPQVSVFSGSTTADYNDTADNTANKFERVEREENNNA